jgi:ElaB/YqjD/DUF883 family membrane-anchored ribosome-binding protein
MFRRTFAPDTEGSPSATTDVATELTALRADVLGLADSVKRLTAEAPDIARESIEASIRRNPLQAAVIAAGVGFLFCLILMR